MVKLIKIYLIMSLGLFLGNAIMIGSILYGIWIFQSFIFFEDNLLILTIETFLSIFTIPAIFIFLRRLFYATKSF